MNKSRIIIILSFSFIGGILLSSLLKIPQQVWLGILFLAVVLIMAGIKMKEAALLGFCLVFLAIGIIRHQSALNWRINDEISGFHNQEIVFKGIVAKEPEKKLDKIKITVESSEIKINQQWQKISGRVLVAVALYPDYSYGDFLEISGQLEEPVKFDDFDYREYLTKDKIYSVIYYPRIKLISEKQGNWFYQIIFNFKDILRRAIDKTLLPGRGSILKAVCLGDKSDISSGLKEKFSRTGVSHIIAISGMHMVIMAEILLFLFLAAGLWRNQAFYLAAAVLAAYILMIGAPASAIRAGIMVGLLFFSQKTGRLNNSFRALVFAGSAMLLINPLLLEIDVGFQLSFAACLGIIYLKPILDAGLSSLSNPFNLRDILTLTFSAQLAVLPLLVFNFGQFSLISPLANLLIVPFLPLLMILGLAISFSGLIFPTLAKIAAFPAWLLLTYFIKTIEFLSSLPGACFNTGKISWIIPLFYYSILILLVRLFKKKKGPFFE